MLYLGQAVAGGLNACFAGHTAGLAIGLLRNIFVTLYDVILATIP